MENDGTQAETLAVNAGETVSETQAVTNSTTTDTTKKNEAAAAVETEAEAKPEKVDYSVYKKKADDALRLSRRVEELQQAHAKESQELQALRQAEQARKDAELSEIERLEKQRSEFETRYQSAVNDLKKERAKISVIQASSDLNLAFKNPSTALKLIESDIQYDASGNPTNIRDLLESLVENEPDLVKKPAPVQTEQPKKQSANANAGSANNIQRETVAQPQTAKEAEAFLAGRSAEEVMQIWNDLNGPLSRFTRPTRS